MNALQSQQDTTASGMMLNPAAMQTLMTFAETMANSRCTIPTHLVGSPADCMAVCMQATQWGMNPFSVAQKTFLVSGTLGYEAQLVNSVIIANAPTKERLAFEWFGDWNNIFGKVIQKTNQKGNKYIAPNWTFEDEKGLGVRVWATFKGEDAPRVLELLLTQAQTRNSTLWASDPRQQLAYLAIKRWSRLYCPEVIMGVYTPDELEPQAEIQINPVPAEPQQRTASTVLNGILSEVSAQDSGDHNLDSYSIRLSDATNLDELRGIYADIKTHSCSLSEDDKQELFGRYQVRKQEIESAA